MTVANVNVTKVLLKRGNTAQNNNYRGVNGELTIDTQAATLRIHDGSTQGGTVINAAGVAGAYSNTNVVAYLESQSITSANIGGSQIYANTNAAVQATAINSLDANVGAFQSYANITLSTIANAASQTTEINSLSANITAANAAITSLQSNAAVQAALLDTLTGNAATQSQVLDTLTSNAATQATTLTTLLSNAVAQQTSLIDLVANAAAQAEAIANVTGTYSNANVATYLSSFDGNILPAANVTYSLGSEQFQWRDLWVSNNTIYIGNTPIRVDAGQLLVNGAPIIGGTTSSIENGDSNVAIADPNGAITVSANNSVWTFGTDGMLTLPNGSVIKDTSTSSISFGDGAGATDQGASAVAVGEGAGYNTQGNQAVAVGRGSGNYLQGNGAVGIGFCAGATEQGDYAVAIGFKAARGNMDNDGTPNQPANSIMINASSTPLNGDQAGLYINPVREDTANVAKAVYYNTTTKELTYANTAGGGGAGLPLANGTTNFDIATENGNATISVYGFGSNNTWTFDTDGFVNLPNGGVVGDIFGEGMAGIQANPNDSNSYASLVSSDKQQAVDANNDEVRILTDDSAQGGSSTQEWRFDRSGNLTFPDSTVQTTAWTGVTYSNVQVATYLPTYSDNIAANISKAGYTWTFGTDGRLTFPDSTIFNGNTFTSPETNGTLKNFKWEFSDLSYGADTVTLQWNLLDTTFPQWYLTTNSQGNIYVFDGDAKTIGFLDNSINSGTVTFGTAANNGAGGTNDIELTTVTGNAYIRTSTNSWKFDVNGNLIIPGNINYANGVSILSGLGGAVTGNISVDTSAIQFVASSSGDGNGYSTIRMIPDTNLEGTDQYVIIDPTAPGHIHIRAGGTQDNSSADLILGGEESHVRVTAGSNPPVYIRANSASWMFGVDSSLSMPTGGNLYFDSSAVSVIDGMTSIRFADATTQTTAWTGTVTFGNTIAIGYDTGTVSQGGGAVAVGSIAGNVNQGVGAVAVGEAAGRLSQGTEGIAVGKTAGEQSQGAYSIAIGSAAAYYQQRTGAVAIGTSAGALQQGDHAIAIGTGAGNALQGNNSIILNATGSTLDQITANTFTVAPIRDTTSSDGVLQYNATTKEVSYNSNLTLNVLKIEDGVHEKFQTKSNATGTVTHDCSSGHIFYHTLPSANWTSNFTNLNLSSGYATTVTLVVEQGATGYYPLAVEIGGSAVPLAWQGNTTPTPSSNRIDVVTFSILNDGLYTVLGQLTGF